MGDDPMHVMMRQIMALFDEYQSKENAKHVLRAMNENARQVAGGRAMILKAKERGDASQLARYLLALRDNDHVALHELRGFVSDDLAGAFAEADAIARGTRCKNYLFSMSLNPPPGAAAGVDTFERAMERIEQKLGLENQPRAVVFHEKDGRRHAHVVWSRIDSRRMRPSMFPALHGLSHVSSPCSRSAMILSVTF